MPKGQPERERFWSRVRVTPGCWEWTGGKIPEGYGAFYKTGAPNNMGAHRYSYEIHVGLIPQGLVLDHLCGNRGCVNPDHLEAVRQRTNVLRGSAPPARNAEKTHCPKGHPYSEDNTYLIRTGGRACRTCRRDNQRVGSSR